MSTHTWSCVVWCSVSVNTVSFGWSCGAGAPPREEVRRQGLVPRLPLRGRLSHEEAQRGPSPGGGTTTGPAQRQYSQLAGSILPCAAVYSQLAGCNGSTAVLPASWEYTAVAALYERALSSFLLPQWARDALPRGCERSEQHEPLSSYLLPGRARYAHHHGKRTAGPPREEERRQGPLELPYSVRSTMYGSTAVGCANSWVRRAERGTVV